MKCTASPLDLDNISPIQAIGAAPITTNAGFVAEVQATIPFAQPRRQLHQKLGTVLENTELAKLAAAANLRKSYTNRRASPSRGQACARPIRHR